MVLNSVIFYGTLLESVRVYVTGCERDILHQLYLVTVKLRYRLGRY